MVAVIDKINLGRDLARLDVWTDAFTKTDECNDMNSSQISTRINKTKMWILLAHQLKISHRLFKHTDVEFTPITQNIL